MNGRSLQHYALGGVAAWAISSLSLSVLGASRAFLMHDPRGSYLLLVFFPVFLLSTVVTWYMLHVIEADDRADAE